MRILYMHQHFTTHHGFTGNRSYEFAKVLTSRGHEVYMICSGIDNEPRLTLPRGRLWSEVEIDGIHCIPIAAAIANPLKITAQGGYRRMLSFLHFSRLAGQVGQKLPKPDIVFASHTPLPIGLAGISLGRYFSVPFVFEVRDLWPDALINLGALKNPLAIWWMRRMERKIYRAAQHIVALSPGMKAGIMRSGIADEKITVIPNAADLDLFSPAVDRQWGRDRLQLGQRFAAIYFGGMGMANGLEYVVEAARVLQDRGRKDIVCVLHGGGGQRSMLEQRAAEYGLQNLVFSDPIPDKSAVAKLVAACNVCMTIYRASKEHTWSPNKMFDGLAAGKPVIVNVPGWLREVIEGNGCGYGVDPERPIDLADALERLADDPDGCQQMGANSRRLAESEFARHKLAMRLERVFEDVLACRSPQPHGTSL
ncbi:MAG: glycosyltransferase family 4 protein [Planctomycetota bacterium]|nr:glycosyltransferase family 4 protein [Planctomycetota bacterium]MDA1180155.1 glycosyltransferase family 4 protein [Planctomycetota bacterium]